MREWVQREMIADIKGVPPHSFPKGTFLLKSTGVWFGVIAYVVYMAWLVKSGMRPTRNDPTPWCDRAIRIVGGIVIGSALLAGLLLSH